MARPWKTPGYLSPRRRPAMSGRSLSQSSDRSVNTNNSGRSDDHGDALHSGHSTPLADFYFEESSHEIKEGREFPFVKSPRASGRPISGELPRIKRSQASSSHKPSEHLSGTSDMSGGYFARHENARNHLQLPQRLNKDSRTTHHFTQATSRGQSLSTAAEASRRLSPDRSRSDHAASPNASSNTPVAGYLLAGFHDNPLPIGKYYPSNWERENGCPSHSGQHSPLTPPPWSSMNQSGRNKSPTGSNLQSGSAEESDVRRKLQQYQRDMINQAKLAASNLLTAVPLEKVSKLSANGRGTKATLELLRRTVSTPYKPLAPKLTPLEGPGPVTPLVLEEQEDNCLGRGPHASLSSKEDSLRFGAGYTSHTM